MPKTKQNKINTTLKTKNLRDGIHFFKTTSYEQFLLDNPVVREFQNNQLFSNIFYSVDKLLTFTFDFNFFISLSHFQMSFT